MKILAINAFLSLHVKSFFSFVDIIIRYFGRMRKNMRVFLPTGQKLKIDNAARQSNEKEWNIPRINRKNSQFITFQKSIENHKEEKIKKTSQKNPQIYDNYRVKDSN